MTLTDILSAKSYLDLFPNVGIVTDETIKKQYRKLVKIAHPDTIEDVEFTDEELELPYETYGVDKSEQI